MPELAPRGVPDLAQLQAGARAMLAALDAAGMAVVTAESCTGGFLASLLTDIEELSHAFERGYVTYSRKAKQQMLGVPQSLIDREGAVSAPVARAMVENSLARSQAGLALAITGSAGLADPSEREGLGVTYIAAAIRQQSWVYRIDYGDRPRHEVRNLATAAALMAGMRALTEPGFPTGWSGLKPL